VIDVAADAPVLRVEGSEVRVITLNRPAQRNALDGELHTALVNEIRSMRQSPELRAVVITGAGTAFSAGGDLDLIVAMQANPAARRASLDTGRLLFREMTDLDVPVVAAVNGPAVGAGCTLALLADVVFIADDTYIADPHVGVGLVPGDGGAVIWPLLAGLSTARAYLLTGDRIPAAEAHRLGLVHQSVPAGELLGTAIGYARRLADLPAFAVQQTKRILNLHVAAAASTILEVGLEAEDRSFDSPDHRSVLASLRAPRGT
jgi:enoyl-CoA hydratase